MTLKQIKSIALTVVGLIATIFSLLFLIKNASYEVATYIEEEGDYFYGYYSSLYFNEGHLVLVLLSSFLLVFALYNLYVTFTNKKLNYNVVKGAAAVTAGAIGTIASFILFILNRSFEDYGKGSWDLSFNEDHLVATIAYIIILAVGIYYLSLTIKNMKMHYLVAPTFGATVASLLSFYPLGVFFKAVSKKKPLDDKYGYLYIGIFGVILLSYFLISIYEKYKENKE